MMNIDGQGDRMYHNVYYLRTISRLPKPKRLYKNRYFSYNITRLMRESKFPKTKRETGELYLELKYHKRCRLEYMRWAR